LYAQTCIDHRCGICRVHLGRSRNHRRQVLGKLDLATFTCTDVSRSSFINRACFDKAKRFMVVQLKTVYYPYCEMPAGTYDAFLAAPSMGKYYNANIKGTGQDGPFDCRTHPVPKY
jgi:hypothetical protein